MATAAPPKLELNGGGYTAPPKRKHPKGLPVLFATEMWERFSFYAMLAILALYMHATPEEGGLGFSMSKTGQIFGLYNGIVYFTPIFGGYIADRYLGIRRTVLLGGAFFVLGHFLLAFRPLPFFFSGLVCLIIGNGLFKPNISTMVGNLYRRIPEKKDDGYNIFYMGINLGAFISPLAAAYLRSLHPIHGWHYAFGMAGIGMLFSMAVFIGFQRLVKDGDIGSAARKLDHKKVEAKKIDPKTARERIVALFVIYAAVVFFYMAFTQQGLTLTFWAKNATRTSLSPEMFSSVNPFFILTLTFPLIFFWQFLRRRGKEPSTVSKLAIGMLLTAVAFSVMAVAGLVGGDTGKVSVAWLITAYAFVTTGELCLSPMGLSLVSKLAPPDKLGLMMGCWFVATAVGNYLAGMVGGNLWEKMPHSRFFMILVATSLVVFFIMLFLKKKIAPIVHEAEMEAAQENGN